MSSTQRKLHFSRLIIGCALAFVFLWPAATAELLQPASATTTESYSYDSAGRLTQVVYGDGSSIQYSYDNNGNILSIQASSEPIIDPIIIEVKAPNTQSLIDAVNVGNSSTVETIINLMPGDNGETNFMFSKAADGFDSALPYITREIEISGGSGSGAPIITLAPTIEMTGEFRLFRVTGEGMLGLYYVTVEGFGAPLGDGGAGLVGDMGGFYATDVHFLDNTAAGNGGALAGHDLATITIFDSEFWHNSSGIFGGAQSIEDSSKSIVELTRYQNNGAGVFGSDFYLSSILESGEPTLIVKGSQIVSAPSATVSFDEPFGYSIILNSTWDSDEDAMDSTGKTELWSSSFSLTPGVFLENDTTPSQIMDLCNDFGSGAFESLGYNIAADNSCALDQETDLPDTDPMIAPNADGFLVPLPGSPAIDSGPIDVIVFDGDDLASLPCGYRDLSGTARPQDANGDGVFECDRGAMEVPGVGEIVAGHSAAFFNVFRDGEGNFVEILNDSLAVVYTFTYRPDGSGPAWFIGVGDINANAIVIDELLRPIGTSFGDDFDADELEFTPIGGMSMVFPDCEAANPGGNIAYTGDVELGYEGLISRATRLSHITGCGAETPDPNAGLSGSYFDPARNGEGVIVQWLDNGQVLVIFFTYDLNDNQFWVLGIAAADGNTVTMDVLYPSTYTPWGRGFNAGDITLSDWGTFTLSWTECNKVTFDYASLVEGFGSATRSYTRLSNLSGTSCPEF